MRSRSSSITCGPRSAYGRGVLRLPLSRAGCHLGIVRGPGVVILALEGEEIVDGRNHGVIGGGEAKGRPARKRFEGGDRRTLGSHDRGAGHLTVVDEAGELEVAGGDCRAIIAMCRRICSAPAESVPFRCSSIRPPSGSGVKRWVEVYWLTPMATVPATERLQSRSHPPLSRCRDAPADRRRRGRRAAAETTRAWRSLLLYAP